VYYTLIVLKTKRTLQENTQDVALSPLPLRGANPSDNLQGEKRRDGEFLFLKIDLLL